MTQSLPDYDNPPVVETVCGVLFRELRSMHAVHLGSLWKRISDEYPQSREVPPLAPAIERFQDTPKPQLQLSDVPPFPRTWLLTKDEDRLIQIQRDRFLHNWKKVRPEDQYPRYKDVIDRFKERFAEFCSFVKAEDLGDIEPLQYEMTYVNHIPKGEGWNSLADVGDIFPDFTQHSNAERFLPTPDQVNWRTSFQLPEKQGRLHVVIRNVQRTEDSHPIILFELTARGMPNDTSLDAMWEWFDLAHIWIVNGFTDLTDSDVRRTIWEQIR